MHTLKGHQRTNNRSLLYQNST